MNSSNTMTTSHFDRLSQFVVAKVTSYLADEQDDPRDIMNLMRSNKMIKECIKSNFVLKPSICDIQHFLTVTKNICVLLQDEITAYQLACDIPSVDHVHIDVLHLTLYPKKSKEWKSYHMRIRSSDDTWKNTLGINMLRWFYTEEDISKYWKENNMDWRTLEVFEAHVYLATQNKNGPKVGTNETETGVLLYALTIIAAIFPSIKQHNYFSTILENFEDVLQVSGSEKCKLIFKERATEIPKLVEKFVVTNNLKKINLKV